MILLCQFLSFSVPAAGLLTVLNHWLPFYPNSLQFVTLTGMAYFLGFSIQVFVRPYLSPNVIWRAALSSLLLTSYLPILRSIILDQNTGIAFTVCVLILHGFLFVFPLSELRLSIVGNVLCFLLTFGVIRTAHLFPIRKPSEKILFENYEWERRFHFSIEERKGALPVHRLYRNEKEKFNGEKELMDYHCLVSLPLYLDRVLRGGPKRVLILGGADGLAARSALIFSSVKEIQIVDPDNRLFELAKTEEKFRIYHLDSLAHRKTKFSNSDPLPYLANTGKESFDVIIIDWPEKRYYTLEFFSLVSKVLSPRGTVAMEVTNVFLPQMHSINLLLGMIFSATAVKDSAKERYTLLLSKTDKPITDELDLILNGPLRLPCKRKDLPTNASLETPTLGMQF